MEVLRLEWRWDIPLSDTEDIPSSECRMWLLSVLRLNPPSARLVRLQLMRGTAHTVDNDNLLCYQRTYLLYSKFHHCLRLCTSHIYFFLVNCTKAPLRPKGMILKETVEGDDNTMQLLPVKISQWDKIWGWTTVILQFWSFLGPW